MLQHTLAVIIEPIVDTPVINLKMSSLHDLLQVSFLIQVKDVYIGPCFREL